MRRRKIKSEKFNTHTYCIGSLVSDWCGQWICDTSPMAFLVFASVLLQILISLCLRRLLFVYIYCMCVCGGGWGDLGYPQRDGPDMAFFCLTELSPIRGDKKQTKRVCMSEHLYSPSDTVAIRLASHLTRSGQHVPTAQHNVWGLQWHLTCALWLCLPARDFGRCFKVTVQTPPCCV